MGRAPCCDKANVKRGPWSPEEDAKLKSYIEQHGTGGNWIALPQKIGLKRCGKSCRLRWLNYLRPNIKHGGFSEEEDRIICSLYVSIGSRWSVIAAQLPGRTDNDIKNYWNTRLKKKLLGKHRKEQQARRGKITSTSTSSCSTATSSVSQQQQQVNYNNSTENTWPLPIPQNTSATATAQPPHPFWPHMPPVLPPLPYSFSMSMTSKPPSQDSIRNLLIKLGGRFSDDDDDHHHLYHPHAPPPPPPHHHQDGFLNFQLPDGATPPSSSPSTLQLPIYDEEQLNMVSSSPSSSSAAASMNAIIHNNNQPLPFSQSHYSGINLVQATAGSSFTEPPLEHMSLSDDPPSLEGLDFLYAEHMIHDKVIGPTTSCDTNSMLYPPLLASNYDSMSFQFAFQHS